MRGIAAQTGPKLLITLAVGLAGLLGGQWLVSGDTSGTGTVAPAVEQAASPLPLPAPQPVPEAQLASADGSGPLIVKSVLSLDRSLQHGDYAWSDEGVAAGPLLITVDLSSQLLSVYRGGVEIGRAVILYGATDKPTPTGEFKVTQMKRDHISNLYNAPMPYMLRLTNDGVAIHGSNVEWGSATHGCIGVPEEFAALLFEQARLGTRVLISGEAPVAETA
jgi:hypothetical protein